MLRSLSTHSTLAPRTFAKWTGRSQSYLRTHRWRRAINTFLCRTITAKLKAEVWKKIGLKIINHYIVNAQLKLDMFKLKDCNIKQIKGYYEIWKSIEITSRHEDRHVGTKTRVRGKQTFSNVPCRQLVIIIGVIICHSICLVYPYLRSVKALDTKRQQHWQKRQTARTIS